MKFRPILIILFYKLTNVDTQIQKTDYVSFCYDSTNTQ